jgi:two-component system sensor histidine kinase BaeS
LIGRVARVTMPRVRPGITFKLFAAILAASAAAAAAMAFATRWSFQSGFLGYLNQIEAQRLDTLSARLADEYHKRGDWNFVRDDYARLRQLALVEQPVPRLTLLDASRRLVAGNPELAENAAVRPVLVEGRTVGWIARTPFGRLTSAAELSFQQEQLRASWVIAALSLALAASLALVLARVFLQPVKRIAQATHRLAAGEYGTRVALRSRDELGRLAEDFNRLAETLERNEQLRRRFMADVSHELRTPLAILKGGLEAIEDGVRPLSRESLASLEHELAALEKLVEDLYQLALADVGALAYRKEPLELAPLVAEALETFGERFRAKRIAVHAALGNGRVLGDADRLAQALRNLLENSLRYTDPGGEVRVACGQRDDRFVLTVEDSAPGVPAEALERLFERFYRVEASRSRAAGGAGLGLALCRSIVEAHGGTVRAHPSALGGLALDVVIPALA